MIFSGRPNGLKPSPYPAAVGYGILAKARAQVRAWDYGLRHLRATQEKQLFETLAIAAGTEFGRKHHFARLRSYEDFRAAVPLGDYDASSPYIDRMRRGARNVLVPGFVEYFGCSSGSSTRGKIKYLPITNRQIKLQTGASTDAFFRFLAWKDDAHFTDGWFLGLLAPTAPKREGPIWVTSNPALNLMKMPRFGRVMYLPDAETMALTDYEKKLAIIAERYLDYDVRMVTGTTCWFSVLFDRLLEEARRRGRHVDCVADLWPNLNCLVGGGVAAGPYLGILRQRLGRDDVTLVDTYNATEGGIYAATDHGGGPGMLMIPHRGVFFELVPVETESDPHPKRVPLWEVEKDRLYHIVVTTPSGMYAYMLGDYVRFPMLEPLRIEFAGRKQGCLSTTQELTTHLDLQKAFAAAVAAAGGTAVDFAAGADIGTFGSGAKSRYVLFTEFEAGREPSDMTAFVRAFDVGLCDANRVYKEYRADDLLIAPPELVVLPKGSVDRYLHEEGRGNVQGKFPRIVSEERKAVLRSYQGRSTLLS